MTAHLSNAGITGSTSASSASKCYKKNDQAKECTVNYNGSLLLCTGANIIGVNCRFGPWTSLQTMKLMKEGLRDAGLQAHLMVQCLGFHTPDYGKGGFVDLPEYPFGKLGFV